jgi:Spy/CpxP family protein refolding chaperone
MVRILETVLLTAAFLLLPGAPGAFAQDMAMMDDHDAMLAMMPEHGMEDGMGPGGCGGCGQGMGMPEMRGPGRGMMAGFGKFWKLDLNQEQRSRLNRIQYDLRRQHWNLKGKIIDEQAKLYDLHAADRPDPKKIGAVYGAIFDIRRQMIESTIEAMNRARDVLTREQQARLKQLPQGCMTGPGGHHQMMHQMMSGGTGTK